MKKKKFIRKNKLKILLNFYKVICLLLVGLLIFSFKAYADKKTVNIINKEIVNPNIVMLWDSITDYYDLNEFYGEDKLIVNSGISGNRVEDISKNLKSRVYNYNPSKVFLLIGINDILWGNAESNYVYDKTIEIVNSIHNKLPNSKIYIESIYPYNGEFDNHYSGETPDESLVTSKILDINKRLREYSTEYDYIKYIDLFDKLKNDENHFDMEYTDDGLHPNRNGYELITSILKKYM